MIALMSTLASMMMVSAWYLPLFTVGECSLTGMLDLTDHMSVASKDAYINQLKNELSRTVLCTLWH